jgi:hypothetical protein
LIGGLYALERAWDEAKVEETRAALRQEHFVRPLWRLRRLVSALQARALPKSGLGQACAYLLGHWAPLTAHLPPSHTKPDTHSVENAIHPPEASGGSMPPLRARPFAHTPSARPDRTLTARRGLRGRPTPEPTERAQRHDTSQEEAEFVSG